MKTTQLNGIATATSAIELLNGYYISQSIFVIASLDIPSILRSDQRSVEELAETVGANADFLLRIMRALSKFGVFDEVEKGVFANNATSWCFSDEAEFSLRPLALIHQKHFWNLWGSLEECVLKGASVVTLKEEANPFSMLARDDEKLHSLFNKSLANLTRLDSVSIAHAFDFSGVQTILDVGGGAGQLSFDLVRLIPGLKAHVLDIESVRHSFLELRNSRDVGTVEFIGGNFFQSLPPIDWDVAILKNVLHDWNDTDAVRILSSCRDGILKTSQRILIVELVLEEDEEPLYGRLRDLNMMVSMKEGRERAKTHWISLMARAGLRIVDTLKLASGQSILVLARE